MRLSLLEIFLVQVVLYSLVWLVDEYIGTFICIVFPAIIATILLISLVVELIEPSRVSRKYYAFMAISIVAPILTGLGFYILYAGQLSWLD